MGKFIFALGLQARDTLTGFAGIIRYRVNYLTGCNQYGLQPRIVHKPDVEQKLPEASQFDENIIEITGQGVLTDEQYQKWQDSYQEYKEKQQRKVKKTGKTVKPKGGPQPVVK